MFGVVLKKEPRNYVWGGFQSKCKQSGSKVGFSRFWPKTMN